MLKKEANKITGGLSAPGKMPEGSYNIPASACQTGADPGQGRTRHAMPSSVMPIQPRAISIFQMLKTALATQAEESLTHPQWVEAMTTLVKKIRSTSAGTTQETYRAWTISRKFLKSVIIHQGPCTGCQRRSVGTCRWAPIQRIY